MSKDYIISFTINKIEKFITVLLSVECLNCYYKIIEEKNNSRLAFLGLLTYANEKHESNLTIEEINNLSNELLLLIMKEICVKNNLNLSYCEGNDDDIFESFYQCLKNNMFLPLSNQSCNLSEFLKTQKELGESISNNKFLKFQNSLYLNNIKFNFFPSFNNTNLSPLISKINAPIINKEIADSFKGLSSTLEQIGKAYRDNLAMSSLQQTILSIKQAMLPMQQLLQPLQQAILPLQQIMQNFSSNLNLKELFESYKKAKDNPRSLINYRDYADKLSDFIWTVPYKITSEEMKQILENIISEKDFDKEMLKYFTNTKMSELFIELNGKMPKKHQLLLKQIINNYNNKNYAILNIAMMTILDDLCSFFLEDKGNMTRNDIFIPIIEEIDCYTEDVFAFLGLEILNKNINTIFESISFNNNSVKITSNKKVRRHPSLHGKKFSNNKVDSIMLFNTLYYLLLVIESCSAYKDKLIFVRNEKELKKARVYPRELLKGFYIKKHSHTKSLESSLYTILPK